MKKKGRVIINIRNFNNFIILNIYLIFLQINIIIKFLKCMYLSIFNVIFFFQ